MMNRPFNNRKRFFMFPLMGLAFAAAGGLAVMVLWNAILPPVISGVGALTYMQAVGLLILCRILFGGFRRGGSGYGHRGGHPWKEKMMNMSEEEREKFRSQWKERFERK